MRRFGLCLAFFQCLLLAIVIPATAQPASAQPAVTLSAEIRGEVLVIDAVVRGGASVPKLRMNPDPSYLEMAFPSSKLASSPGTQSIDRGLIRKVQLGQDGSTALARIFVMSKPRTEFTRTSDGARYTIYLNQLAGTTPTAAAPSSEQPAPAEPARPSAAAPAPGAAAPTEPARPSAAAPPATAAPAPAEPARPSAAATPATPAPAAPTPPAERPVSAVFQGAELSDALNRLAEQAGMRASIDRDLPGSITLSISEMPFQDAVTLLIQPYGDQLEVAWSPNQLIVRRSAPTAPAPSTSSSSPSSATPASSAGPAVAGEYFPFKSKDAQKMMEAAKKAIPDLSYKVDSQLNIVLVEGPPEEIERLKQLLDAMSPK